MILGRVARDWGHSEIERYSNLPDTTRSCFASDNILSAYSHSARGAGLQPSHPRLQISHQYILHSSDFVGGGLSPLLPGPHATKIRRPLLGG